MLAAAGGGGTPWESMDLDTMQRLIQSPSTDKQWELVTGWQRSAELLSEHRFQVQDYRDNLASAWPPEKSAASAAYLGRLDELIANLTETYEATLANHDAMVAATGSIYQAQVKMNKIFEEYANNKSALETFTAKQNSPTPTPSPSPSGEQPPVAPGRQEELRVQAAMLLSSVSTDLAQAQVRLRTPAPYEGKYFDGKTESNDGSSYVPPPIPPITSVSVSDSSSGRSGKTPSATFPTHSSVVQPVTTPPGLGAQQPGIVLGGATPPALTPQIGGPNPLSPTLPSGVSGPLTNPGLVSPGGTLLPRGSSSVLPRGTNGAGRGVGLPREGLIRPGGSLPEGMRAMPPGGIIGGTPGVGLGQPASNRAGARRVNPVGGVIGESGSGPATRRGASSAGMVSGERASGLYGQGSAQRSDRRAEADDLHWDPDNPWETAEGVAPVVLPVREQRIDPGPAIGLG